MKKVLLKLTGELLLDKDGNLSKERLSNIAKQIKELKDYKFGIVIGGGAFFRGSQEGSQLGLTPSVGHYVGMLATVMNGLIAKDIFKKEGLKVKLLSAIYCPQIAEAISQQNIDAASEDCIIFAGGTGNPFFTTDTNAMLRALQIGANEVWKGTKVDGIYNMDPKIHPDAKLLKKLTYKEALDRRLGVLDPEALILAEKGGLKIRVFNALENNSIITAVQDKNFGSIIEG